MKKNQLLWLVIIVLIISLVGILILSGFLEDENEDGRHIKVNNQSGPGLKVVNLIKK